MEMRTFLEQFAHRSDLRRIRARVSANLELAAICRSEFAKPAGQALWFEDVEGFSIPVVANLFGTQTRMQSVMRHDVTAFGEHLRQLLSVETGPAEARIKHLSTTREDSVIVQPDWKKHTRTDLRHLPALLSWPKEVRPYLTLPLVFTRDPQTGEQNLGLYRVQVLNQTQAAINFASTSGAGKHLASATEINKPLSVALVFGCDLALYWLAAASLPAGCNEFGLYEKLFAEVPSAVETEQGLRVPEETEILVEGQITPGRTCVEGPFGNHTGRYVVRNNCPVFELNSISCRPEPIMPVTVVGPPPSENIFLARYNCVLIEEMLRIGFPEIETVMMPESTIFHGVALLQVNGSTRRTAAELIQRLWDNSPLRNARVLILLDADLDCPSFEQAYWRLINQLNPKRLYQRGTQIAIDATGVDPADLVSEDRRTLELLQRRQHDYDR